MGREMNPATKAVRGLLEKNPDLTFSEAQPSLEKMGFALKASVFNQAKLAWKKKGQKGGQKVKPRVDKKAEADVTDAEALHFVRQAGGLAKAEEEARRAIACVRKARALQSLLS